MDTLRTPALAHSPDHRLTLMHMCARPLTRPCARLVWSHTAWSRAPHSPRPRGPLSSRLNRYFAHHTARSTTSSTSTTARRTTRLSAPYAARDTYRRIWLCLRGRRTSRVQAAARYCTTAVWRAGGNAPRRSRETARQTTLPTRGLRCISRWRKLGQNGTKQRRGDTSSRPHLRTEQTGGPREQMPRKTLR